MKYCRQKNNNFMRLLRKYRTVPTSSSLRPDYFEGMKECAKTFWEWSWIYQLAGNSSYTGTQALDKMKATFLYEKNSFAVKMNILELFEIVTDEEEQKQMMKMFLNAYQEKKDLVFAIALGPVSTDIHAKAVQYYASYGGLSRAIEYEKRRIVKMRTKSSFMKSLKYRY